MKIDRCYLLLGAFNRTARAGGSDFFSINLREILGGLYDKYSRFNLKLEAYASRVATAATQPNEVQFLSIIGFNWLNGYESNPLYPNSRMAGVMFYEGGTLARVSSENYKNIIYPSNIATLMFSKNSNPQILLEMFATDADSDNKLASLFGNESPSFLFSITGVEEPLALHKSLPRSAEVVEMSGQLVLNTQYALALETNKRAVRWTVDLSQIINSSTYSKYSKFAIITKKIGQITNFNPSDVNVTSIDLLMSGLDWYSTNLKLTRYGGDRTFLTYHNGAPNCVAVFDTANVDYTKETFIDNIFYKPASPIVELTLTYNTLSNLLLIGVTAPLEPMSFIFNIVPVDDF